MHIQLNLEAERGRPVQFNRHTFFEIGFQNDELIARLVPFIEAVHRGTSEGLRTAVLRAASSHPELASYFHIVENEIEETFGLRPEYLFPQQNPISGISIRNRMSGSGLRFSVEDLPVIERCLSLCGMGQADEQAIRDEIDDELVDALLRYEYLQLARPSAGAPPPREPGIVRLQHASLLYRSETTGILVDPHFHSEYEPADLGDTWASKDLHELVDAILISHSHGDHFSLSTLMLFPRDLPIVVPHVPRASLIGPDMAQLLRSVGFTRVLEPAWYSPSVKIGDFEIDVLPFFGEQPLRDEAPRHPDLRNWGNTYYLRSPHYSSWFLIDSGDDPRGRMAEVAEHVASRLGGVDYLLSNLNVFGVGAARGAPDYITSSGHYWLSLHASQLTRFSSLCGQALTLGPEGVAEVAHLARAKTFLPYAHWWTPMGTRSQKEAVMLRSFVSACERRGARPKVVPWLMGDSFHPEHARSRSKNGKSPEVVGASSGGAARI